MISPVGYTVGEWGPILLVVHYFAESEWIDGDDGGGECLGITAICLSSIV